MIKDIYNKKLNQKEFKNGIYRKLIHNNKRKRS